MVGAVNWMVMALQVSRCCSVGADDWISLQVSSRYLVGANDWISLQSSGCYLVGAVGWIIMSLLVSGCC